MMRRLLICLSLVGGCTASAAPIPKGKEQLPATEQQRKTARDNLDRIMSAINEYQNENGFFPIDIGDKKGKALLNWRVAILPYLDNKELYAQFALDESWDSKTNKPLILKMPKAFAPVRVEGDPGETFYRGFSGKGTFFETGNKLRITNITNGTINTIAVIEAGESVYWTKPVSDIPFDSDKPLPLLGKDIDGEFHAVRPSGEVIRIKRDFDAAALKKQLVMDSPRPPINVIGK